MAKPPDDIESVPRQAQIECLDERARGELGGHKHITENTDALSSNYRLDRMQLLPKTEMLHVLEFGQIAPLASGNR